MGSYNIAFLERISGIKAHTLRIWEQRFGILRPRRNEHNVRIYDDEHLKKVLNIKILIDAGYKIGEISKFGDLGLIEHSLELQQSDETWKQHGLLDDLTCAALSYSTDLFDAVYSKATSRLGLYKTYLNVIHPMLVRMGILWSSDQLLAAQEHFISNLIRQKLYVAIDGLPKKKSKKESWLLFLPEDEEHDIGLLFASFLLQLHGHEVIYLGSRVPLQNVQEVQQKTSCDHHLIFLVKRRNILSTQEFLEAWMLTCPGVKKTICAADQLLAGVDIHSRIQHFNAPEPFHHWVSTKLGQTENE